MAETADDKQRDDLLKEAMKLLTNVESKLGMFERQSYMRLKHEFDQREALPIELRGALNGIKTD